MSREGEKRLSKQGCRAVIIQRILGFAQGPMLLFRAKLFSNLHGRHESSSREARDEYRYDEAHGDVTYDRRLDLAGSPEHDVRNRFIHVAG